MDLPRWLLERGGDAQVALFFSGLVLFALLEALRPRRTGPRDRRRRWPTNGALTALTIAVLPLVPISFIAAGAWAESRGLGLLNQGAWPTWAVVVVTLLVRGLVSTGTHWLNHKVPWLWRLHRVHHLDTEVDVSTTVRFHPLEMLVNPFIGVPVIVAFGLSPWVLAFYELLDVAVTLFSHSNLRLPGAVDRWLRYVIVTPDLHRVHHSTWQPETDSNFGAVFPVWDLVLGTFRAAPRDGHERMELGLAELRGTDAQRLLPLLLSPARRELRPARPAAAPARSPAA